MAKEWRAMSPVAIRDEEMGARTSDMLRAYGAAYAGTGLVGTFPPRRFRIRNAWSSVFTP